MRRLVVGGGERRQWSETGQSADRPGLTVKTRERENSLAITLAAILY